MFHEPEDDLLYSYLRQGKQYMDKLLGKFDIGTQECDSFRYCGKKSPEIAGGITIDVRDSTLNLEGEADGNGAGETKLRCLVLRPREISQICSVLGSFLWIA